MRLFLAVVLPLLVEFAAGQTTPQTPNSKSAVSPPTFSDVTDAAGVRFRHNSSSTSQKYLKWGIHLTQVAPRRCGLVDPWTPAHCTQNAPWG